MYFSKNLDDLFDNLIYNHSNYIELYHQVIGTQILNLYSMGYIKDLQNEFSFLDLLLILDTQVTI